MRIKPEHGMSIGYCAKGMREFATRHGWSWAAICQDGIDEEELLATGDDMAIKIVEAAHGRKLGSDDRV